MQVEGGVCMEYGRKIAELREQHQMSQQELADALFVSRELVSKWENNTRRPDYKTLTRLSELFSVELSFFASATESFISELETCVPKDGTISAEHLPALLNAFLETLSTRDRSVFIRRYYFMETPAEIGERFQINEVYVRVILSRTRNKLCKYLERTELS